MQNVSEKTRIGIYSGLISNLKSIRKPGNYKSSDKRCKICQNYLNKMSTGQVWKTCRETERHSATVIYYLKCKVC